MAVYHPIGERTHFIGVVRAAIKDIVDHGFTDIQRVAFWARRIRHAAHESLITPGEMRRLLQERLDAHWQKLIERERLLDNHVGVQRYVLTDAKPKLRAELERRKAAAASLIRLNREEMIDRTVRRFEGWATSVPVVGKVDGRESAEEVRRGISGLPFIERRVLIDQGHKMTAALNDIVAKEAGAIAARWHSNWRQPGYDYREEHKHRDIDMVFFAIRGNWYMEQGLMKLGGHLYTDQVTAPGTEINCRCWYEYFYNLQDLPEEMITSKGRAWLETA